jgi:hypothetical protein
MPMPQENGKKLRAEIEKRTRETSKLIEIETKKLAVGEMVLERLETILDLLNAAGFKIVSVTTQSPAPTPPLPANTVVVQAGQIPQPAAAPVKNPCCRCGKEAAFDEPMPDGTRKFYCRPHGIERSREKQEEAASASLFQGQTFTNFQRPVNPAAATAQKTIYQHPPVPPPPPPGQSAADLLKGPVANGEPPHNSVLDE